MAGECILIKQSELDEIKKHHPDAKLLEKIQKLEEDLKRSRDDLSINLAENRKLRESPIIQIDPLKIEMSFFEKYVERSNYGNYNSYSGNKYYLIHPVNFSLNEKLRKQIEAIIKLIQERLIRDFEYYKKENILVMEEAIKNKIANMGYWERRKYLKKYRK